MKTKSEIEELLEDVEREIEQLHPLALKAESLEAIKNTLLWTLGVYKEKPTEL